MKKILILILLTTGLVTTMLAFSNSPAYADCGTRPQYDRENYNRCIDREQRYGIGHQRWMTRGRP